jgi:hypothetical protein
LKLSLERQRGNLGLKIRGRREKQYFGYEGGRQMGNGYKRDGIMREKR